MKKLMMQLFAMTLVLSGLLAAQERKWQQKVFDIRNADAQALAGLLRGVMRDRDTRVNENAALKAISVGSYEANDLQAAEELIKRFDIPRGEGPSGAPRNIEVVAYMVLAGKTGSAGDAVPAELDPVVKQLKAVFGYSDYRLMDTAVLRVREGRDLGFQRQRRDGGPQSPGRSLDLSDEAQGDHHPSQPEGQRHSHRWLPVWAPDSLPHHDDADRTRRQRWRRAGQHLLPVHRSRLQHRPRHPRRPEKVVVGKSKVDRTGNAFILVLTAKAVD
ncbi:MAG: hypothetical protein QM757_17860 [Paludibaculum sp.]